MELSKNIQSAQKQNLHVNFHSPFYDVIFKSDSSVCSNLFQTVNGNVLTLSPSKELVSSTEVVCRNGTEVKSLNDCITNGYDKKVENIDSGLVKFVKALKNDEIIDSDSSAEVLVENKIQIPPQIDSPKLSEKHSIIPSLAKVFISDHTGVVNSLNEVENIPFKSDNLNFSGSTCSRLPSGKDAKFMTFGTVAVNSNIHKEIPCQENVTLLKAALEGIKPKSNNLLSVPMASDKELFLNVPKYNNSSSISNSSLPALDSVIHLKQVPKNDRRKSKNAHQTYSVIEPLPQSNIGFNISNSNINFQSIYPSMGLDVDLCDLNVNIMPKYVSILQQTVPTFPDIPIKVEMDITPPSNIISSVETNNISSSACRSPNFDSSDMHVSMTFEAEPVYDDCEDDLPLSLLKEKVTDELASAGKDKCDNVDVNIENSDDIPLSLFIKKELIDEEIIAASQEVSTETVTSKNINENSPRINNKVKNFNSTANDTDKNSNSSLASNYQFVKQIKAEPVDDFLPIDQQDNISSPTSKACSSVTSLSDALKHSEISSVSIAGSRENESACVTGIDSRKFTSGSRSTNSNMSQPTYIGNSNMQTDSTNTSSSALNDNYGAATVNTCKSEVPFSNVKFVVSHKGLIQTSVISNNNFSKNVAPHSEVGVNNTSNLETAYIDSENLNKNSENLPITQSPLKLDNKLIKPSNSKSSKSCTLVDKIFDKKTAQPVNKKETLVCNTNLDIELIPENLAKIPVSDNSNIDFNDNIHVTSDSETVANISSRKKGSKKKTTKNKKKRSSALPVELDENIPITMLFKRKKTNFEENSEDSFLCTSSINNSVNSDLMSNDSNSRSSGQNQTNDLNTNIVRERKSNDEKELFFQSSNSSTSQSLSCETNPKKRKKKNKQSKTKNKKHASEHFAIPEMYTSSTKISCNENVTRPNKSNPVTSSSNSFTKNEETIISNKDSNQSNSQIRKSSSEPLEMKNNTVVYMSFEEDLHADDVSEEDLHSILSVKTENESISSSKGLVQSSESTSNFTSVLSNIKKERPIAIDSEPNNQKRQLGNQHHLSSIPNSTELKKVSSNVSSCSENSNLKDYELASDSTLSTMSESVTSTPVTKKKKKPRRANNGWYKRKKSKTIVKNLPAIIIPETSLHVPERNDDIPPIGIEKTPVVVVKNMLPAVKDTSVNSKGEDDIPSSVTKDIPLDVTKETVEVPNVGNCPVNFDETVQKEDSLQTSKVTSRSPAKSKRKKKRSWSRKRKRVTNKSQQNIAVNSDVSLTSESTVLSEENVRNHTNKGTNSKAPLSRSTSEETLIVSLENVPAAAINTADKNINAISATDSLTKIQSKTKKSKLFNSPMLDVAEIAKEIAEIDRILPSYLANRSGSRVNNVSSNENIPPETDKNSSFQPGISEKMNCSTDSLINLASIKKEPCIDSYTEDQFLKACTTSINTVSTSTNQQFPTRSHFTERSIESENSANAEPSLQSCSKIALAIKREVCDKLRSNSNNSTVNTIKNQKDLIEKSSGVHGTNVNASNKPTFNISDTQPPNFAYSNKSVSMNNTSEDDDIQIIQIGPKSKISSCVDLTDDNVAKTISENQGNIFNINGASNEFFLKGNDESNLQPLLNRKSHSESHSLKYDFLQNNIRAVELEEGSSNQDSQIKSVPGKKAIDFENHKYVAEYFRYPFPATITSRSKSRNKYAAYTRTDAKSWNLSLENVESRLKVSENSISQFGKKLGDIIKLDKFPVGSYEVECYHRILGVAPSQKLLLKCFRPSDRKVSTLDEFGSFSQGQKLLSVNKLPNNQISDKIKSSVHDIIHEISEGKVAAELDDSLSTCTRFSSDSYISNFSEKILGSTQTSELQNLNLPINKELAAINSSAKSDPKIFSETLQAISSCLGINPIVTNSPLPSELHHDVNSCEQVNFNNNTRSYSEQTQNFNINDFNSNSSTQHPVAVQHVNSIDMRTSTADNSQSSLNSIAQPQETFCQDQLLNSELPAKAHETCKFSKSENRVDFNNDLLSSPVPQVLENTITSSPQVVQDINENSNIMQGSANKILSNIDVPVTELLKILETAGSLHSNTRINDNTTSWKSKTTFEYNHTHSIPVVEMDSEGQKVENPNFNSKSCTNLETALNKDNNKELESKNLTKSNVNDSSHEISDDDYVDNEPVNNESDEDENSRESKKKEEEPVPIPQYKSKWEKIMERKKLENEEKQKVNQHLLKDCFPVSSIVKRNVKPKSSDKSISKSVPEKAEKSKNKQSDKSAKLKKDTKEKCKESNVSEVKKKNNKETTKSSPKKLKKQKPMDDASSLFTPDKAIKNKDIKKGTDVKKSTVNSKINTDEPSKCFYGKRVTNRGSFLTESELFKAIKIPKKKTSETKNSSVARSEEFHSLVKSPLIRIEQNISKYNSQKRPFNSYNDTRYKRRPIIRNPPSATSNFQNSEDSQYKRGHINSRPAGSSRFQSERMHSERDPRLNSMHSDKDPRLNSMHSNKDPRLNSLHGNDRVQHKVALLSTPPIAPSYYNNDNIQHRTSPLLNTPLPTQFDNIPNINVPLLNTPTSSHLSIDDIFHSDPNSSASTILKNIMAIIPGQNPNFLRNDTQSNPLPISGHQNPAWSSSTLTGGNVGFLNETNFNHKSGKLEEAQIRKDLPANLLQSVSQFLPATNLSTKSTSSTSSDSTSQIYPAPQFIPVITGGQVGLQTSKKATSICLVPQHLKSLVGHETIETNNLLLLMLEWSVDWLVQQQTFHDPPPISKTLKKVVSSYESFQDYYNTYFPLMLLDTWQRIYVSWTHLNQACPYFCDITSYSVKNHYVNVECQTIFNTTSHPKGVFPDEGSILMIKYGTKCNEFSIKVFGYVTHVKTRRFNPVTDTKICGFKIPEDGKLEVFQVLTLTYMGAYNSEDIDKRLPVRIQVLCSVKSTLKQNDAMLYINKSPLFKSILNPVEDGLLSVSLTPRNSPEEKVIECVRDITRGILSPHPVPLLTIVKAKPESDRLNIIPLLIDKMKNTYKTKVLLCVRTVKSLSNIAANICLHRSIKLVIINKRCDTGLPYQKYLIDELVSSEMAKTADDKTERLHLKNEALLRTKKQILKECDVVLSLIRNCHDDFMGDTFLEAESIAQMCCIVDEANLCTEPETLIPVLHGVSKLILIGDPDYPAKVLSKTAYSYDYHRSFFNRAFDLDSITE